ncbi:MAG: ornithine cyclodeaminase family protein, partial [Gemmatimonadetes bacterium]|nr:ornithine cyclodeaminase family protein [Gemmatimonadota bacterium]
AAPDARVLAIIGSGAQAMAHLALVRPLRAWGEVRLTSPRLAARAALLPEGVSAAPSAHAAVAGADVVLCCTSSGTAVMDPRTLEPHALVTSISTNVADAHEVPPESLAALDVYCDYRATTPASAGEMRLAARHGWSADAIRGDLGELLTHAAPPPTRERPAFFRSIGLGLEDVQLALAILRLHRQESA